MTDKRITLITGASRGIGHALARELAVTHNHHVILCARSKNALESLDDEIRSAGGSATLVPMDLTDPDAADQLGAVVLSRWGRLDGLVGNAGILGPISPVHTVTPKSWQSTLEINLNANWRLIRAFDPLLRLSSSGRAVFLTSSVAKKQRAFWGPYQTSKAALEALVNSWVEETGPTNLKINLFNPGATATMMRADAMPGEDPNTLPTALDVAKKLAEFALEAHDLHGARVNYRDLV